MYSRQNIVGICAAQHFAVEIVRKDFHYNELRFGRNAYKRFRFVALAEYLIVVATCDYTGNVRSVRGIGRIHIAIVVCVIKRKRNFLIDINIRSGSRRHARLFRDRVAQLFVYIIQIPNAFFIYRHIAERIVSIIKSCVEHGNNHAGAVIVYALCIINTRCVNIGVIGSNVHFWNGIMIAVVNAFDAAQLLNARNIRIIHFDRKRIGKRGIRILELVFDARFIHRFEDRILARFHFVGATFSIG